MRRMLGNISELVSARLVRGIGESAHRDRALFRFGWLDAYRRAIHRCILGLDESHSILSARLPLTLPIRSLSLNRFKPGIHCSSLTPFPFLPSFVPSSLTKSIFPYLSFLRRISRLSFEGISVHAQTRIRKQQGPTYVVTYRFLAARSLPRNCFTSPAVVFRICTLNASTLPGSGRPFYLPRLSRRKR